jgi:hypothetical protein
LDIVHQKRLTNRESTSQKQNDINELEKEYRLSSSRVLELEPKIEICEETIAKLGVYQMQRQIQILEEKITKISAEIEQLEDEIIILTKRRITIRKIRFRTKSEKKIGNSVFDDLNAKLVEETKICSALESKRFELLTDVEMFQHRIFRMNLEIDEKNNSIRLLRSRIRDLRGEIESKQSQRERIKSVSFRNVAIRSPEAVLSEYLKIKRELQKIQRKKQKILKFKENLEPEKDLLAKIEQLKHQLRKKCKRVKRNREESVAYVADFDVLNNLQKRIAFAEHEQKEIRDASLRLVNCVTLTPPKPIVNLQLEKSVEENFRNNKKLTVNIELLNYRMEETVQQKQNLEVALSQFGNRVEASKSIVCDFGIEVERIEDRVINRRVNLRRRKEKEDEFERENSVEYFGNGVSLVVRKRDESREENKVNMNLVLCVEKLEKLLRKIELEKEIWKSLVRIGMEKSQLDGWNDDLTRICLH